MKTRGMRDERRVRRQRMMARYRGKKKRGKTDEKEGRKRTGEQGDGGKQREKKVKGSRLYLAEQSEIHQGIPDLHQNHQL